MFYIDDYNSKAITNSPPKKEEKLELDKAKLELKSQQLATFWFLTGATIADKFNEVKAILDKYGYEVVNEKDAAAAISDMLTTPKWPKFIKELGSVIEETVEDRLELKDTSEESGFVAAIIAAAGTIIGGTLGLAGSAKAKAAAKENAKAQMFTGITAVLAEREKRKAQQEMAKAQAKKTTIWAIVTVFIVLAIIIGVVIYKRNKAKAQTT